MDSSIFTINRRARTKFIFAPDSFKGSLSAMESCDILERVARCVFPGVETLSVPVDDGGEGTVDALLRTMGGTRMKTEVTGPLFERERAEWGLLPDGVTAVMEMAQTSGLPYVPADRRDPRHATSLGTGEMIAEALKRGARKILIGIDAVLDAVDFDNKLSGVSLAVTGEGRIDGQSLRFGKVPVGVAKRCAAKGIPTAAIVGGIGGGAEGLYDLCESTMLPTVPGPMSLEDAMANAPILYEQAAERLFRAIRIGIHLK